METIYQKKPMLNPIKSWTLCMLKMFNSYERARRSEFWWYFLLVRLFGMGMIFTLILIKREDIPQFIIGLLMEILMFSATMRRLHDVNVEGKTYYVYWGFLLVGILFSYLNVSVNIQMVLHLATFVTYMFVLAALITDSDKDENDWGESPKYVCINSNENEESE